VRAAAAAGHRALRPTAAVQPAATHNTPPPPTHTHAQTITHPHTQPARSLKLYNALVERCFKDCVLDFRSKNLGKDEEKVR
jgi:hypothetical protein